MDQAKDAEIEEAVDERAEMMDGIMEEDFGTGDLVSDYSAFSGAEVPRTVIYICSVDQDRILLFDQYNNTLYKTCSEEVRRSSDRSSDM
jgi:hypothetical protein